MAVFSRAKIIVGDKKAGKAPKMRSRRFLRAWTARNCGFWGIASPHKHHGQRDEHPVPNPFSLVASIFNRFDGVFGLKKNSQKRRCAYAREIKKS